MNKIITKAIYTLGICSILVVGVLQATNESTQSSEIRSTNKVDTASSDLEKVNSLEKRINDNLEKRKETSPRELVERNQSVEERLVQEINANIDLETKKNNQALESADSLGKKTLSNRQASLQKVKQKIISIEKRNSNSNAEDTCCCFFYCGVCCLYVGVFIADVCENN